VASYSRRCPTPPTPAGCVTPRALLLNAKVPRFAERRRAAKARGLRRVTSSEVDRYASYGWPGDPARREAEGRALDQEFLRKCGMALWEPEPVNVRRRLRCAERAQQPPSRFDGCLLTAMIVAQGAVGLLAWLIFDPTRIFWLTFAAAGMAAVCYAIIEGFRQAARQAPQQGSTVEALERRREALRHQLHRAEQSRAKTPAT
jgi:hypothetical protein